MLVNIFLVGLLACFVESSHVSMGSVSSPETLVQAGRSPPQELHELVFMVRRKDDGLALENELLSRSTPGSDMYQQWMSDDELHSHLYNPSRLKAIRELFAAEGLTIQRYSRHGEFIWVTASIGTWERLLLAEFHDWNDQVLGGKLVRRTLAYSLPEKLHEHVFGTFNALPSPFSAESEVHPRRAKAAPEGSPKAEKNALFSSRANNLGDDNEEAYSNPAFLNMQYNISSNVGSAVYNQTVFEALGQKYALSDLRTFQKATNTPLDTPYNIGGGEIESCNVGQCDEGSLDLQYINALCHTTGVIYWEVADDVFVDNFIVQVSNDPNPPTVISISYTLPETSTSRSYYDAFNQQAVSLGLRGVTIMASSGDSGVNQRGCGTKGCGYTALFPASSPWVTSVGATQGHVPSSSEDQSYPSLTYEQACSVGTGGIITTGGGFSTLFPRPAWQEAQVSAYFATAAAAGKTPTSGYSTTGRGYPDVSMNGIQYPTIIANDTSVLFGTSASSPVFAAMISLVNAARLPRGPLGFINPSLYSGIVNFRDITAGDNHCCIDDTNCTCSEGFTALTGWDPLTGFGSVILPELMKLTNNTNTSPSPTGMPSGQPSAQPSGQPMAQPSGHPSAQPSGQPSKQPVGMPSGEPSAQPSGEPSKQPSSSVPTSQPSRTATLIYSYTVNNQRVNNVSASAEASTKIQIYKKSIKSVQSGSRYKGYNIKNFNLDPSSSRRLQTVDVDDQTDDIFSYVVEFEADQVSGASQRDAQINALVTATMTSGSFAATLADNSPAAFANAEPEMVSQSSIMINDATPIPVIPSGGSDDKYSKGDIAGIVIGTVLGTALLVGLFIYFKGSAIGIGGATGEGGTIQKGGLVSASDASHKL